MLHLLSALAALSFSSALHVPVKQTVWSVFGGIAEQTRATNLGQGFPDWDPPSFVLESLQRSTSHQYTRPAGHPQLVELLAARYSQHLNQAVHPMVNIAVTVGASQALYLTLMSLLSAGDEIIIFEPFFELYTKQIALTGATPRFVPLGGSAATLDNPWALNVEALRSVITEKTKVLLLNSPHNPTGKVFTLQEMEAIAAVVREFPQLTVVSDEVYKYTVYDPLEPGDPTSPGHYHFSRLPDMWERTVTLSSCGKTFSVTGWQVGWLVGPQKFVSPVQQLLPCVQFCAATPIQEALSYALQYAENPYEGYSSYYEWLRQRFIRKRRTLEEGLLAAGIEPMPSNGGFFLMAKLPQLPELLQAQEIDRLAAAAVNTAAAASFSSSTATTTTAVAAAEPYDWRYLRHLALTKGVIGIPASPFFSSSSYESMNQLPPLGRFAFCKRDETLLEAAARLKGGKLQHQNIVL